MVCYSLLGLLSRSPTDRVAENRNIFSQSGGQKSKIKLSLLPQKTVGESFLASSSFWCFAVHLVSLGLWLHHSGPPSSHGLPSVTLHTAFPLCASVCVPISPC